MMLADLPLDLIPWGYVASLVTSEKLYRG